MAGPLGCGEYAVQVRDRSGARLGELDGITSLQWERRRNETSRAAVSVAVAGLSDACCRTLADTRTWRHDLVVIRDGEPVWSGPIIDLVHRSTGTTDIIANDHSVWMSRKIHRPAAAFSGVDLSAIAESILVAAFDSDEPGLLNLLHSTDTGVTADITLDTNAGTAAELLDQLVALGLSWTMVLGRLFLSGRDCIGYLGSWSDSDFVNGIAVVESGLDLVTSAVVLGGTIDDGDATTTDPVATGEHSGTTTDYYGTLERLIRDSDITTDAQALDLAVRTVEAADVAPVAIQVPADSWLDPTVGAAINELLPGVCVDMRSDSTCRTVAQRLQLLALSGSEVAGEGEVERIGATFGPPGADVSRIIA